jgi:hypothetical protein
MDRQSTDAAAASESSSTASASPSGERSQVPGVGAFGLSHDAWGRLVMIDSQGERHVDVEPARAFPISDPEHWISICDTDGRELACVEDLASLAPNVRQVLEDDLARREFVPNIKCIYSVSTDSEPSEWDVDTDRGRTQFQLNSEDDIRRLGTYSALVIDTHGIRYLINDLRTFDATSRRILERYL